MTERNEAIEVQASVIEEQEALSISCAAGSIAANFDAMEAKVDAILADYEGWEPSADSSEDVKQCKAQKKYLNALAKDIDERRKAVKREYLRPLDAFESRANAIRDKVKAVSSRLDAVAKEAEQAEKDAKESALKEHYEAFAGLLADVVPYERIADPKWLNKSTSVKRAEGELEAKVGQVARDWEALKGLGLEYFEQAEAHFFNVLDLGQAVAHNAKLVADRERIEAMKAAMEPEPEPQAACEAPPIPAREPEPELPRYAPGPVYAPPMKEDPPVPMVMVIDACTIAQATEIGRFCGSLTPPVTGAFKMGTLREAYDRERKMAVAREQAMAREAVYGG